MAVMLVVFALAAFALFQTLTVNTAKAQPAPGYYGGNPLVKSGSNWTNGLSSLFYTNVQKFYIPAGKDLAIQIQGAGMVAGTATNVYFQFGRSVTGVDATNQFGVGGDASLAGIEKFASMTLTLNGTATQTICSNFSSTFNGGFPYFYVLYATNAPNGANALTNYQITVNSK